MAGPTVYVHRSRDGREGWTRVRGERQASREADAWHEAGWLVSTWPTTPKVRAMVAAWERRAKGHPGEASY